MSVKEGRWGDRRVTMCLAGLFLGSILRVRLQQITLQVKNNYTTIMSKSDYVVIDYHHAWIQKIFQGVGGLWLFEFAREV